MRPYDLLKNFGIEYLEIRGVDISPSDITGMSKHHIRFLDLILIYCLILPSPKIDAEEKNAIDLNEYNSIYKGRDMKTEIFISGAKVNINQAKENILEDLRGVADHMTDSQLFHEAINHVTALSKGALPEETFHEDGIKKATANLNILKSAEAKNIDSIKKEVALSLKELDKMTKSSKEEMDEFVKNYNLDL